MKRLNVKLLIIVFASTVGPLIGIYLLHGFQVRRTSSNLLKHAEAAANESNYRAAIDHLKRYMAHSPDDHERRSLKATLGLKWIKAEPDLPLIDKRRVMEDVEGALRMDSNNVLLRWETANVYADHGAYSDGLKHLEQLKGAMDAGATLPAEIPSGKIATLVARCQMAVGNTDDAANTLRGALGYGEDLSQPPATKTPDLAAFQLFVEVLRLQLREADADRVVEHMVQVLSNDPHAYLYRAVYLRGRANAGNDFKDRIAADMAKAQELGPDDIDVVVASAQVHLENKQFDEARKSLEAGRAKDPDEIRIYQLLAELERYQDNLPKGIEHIQAGLVRSQNHPELLWLLARFQLFAKDFDAYQVTEKKLRDVKIADVYLRFLAAEELVYREKFKEAREILQALEPELGGVTTLVRMTRSYLAECHRQLNHPEATLRVAESLGDFERAAEACLLLGQVDEALRRYEQLRQSIKDMTPDVQLRLDHRILMLKISQQEQLPESARKWDDVIELTKQVLGHEKLEPVRRQWLAAFVLFRKGDLPQARKRVDDGLKNFPDDLDLWLLALQLKETREEADGWIARLKEKFPDKSATYLAEVQTILRFGGNQIVEQLHQLENEVGSLKMDNPSGFLHGIAMAYLSQQSLEDVSRLWQKQAEMHPENVDIRLRLFSLALQRANEADAQKWREEIAKLSGSDSLEAKHTEARQIIEAARSPANAERRSQMLAQATTLVNDVLAVRQQWPDALKLLADIHLLQANHDGAIDALTRCLQVTPQDATVQRVLSKELYLVGRVREAYATIERVNASVVTADDKRLKVAILDRLNQIPDALKLVRGLVAENEFNSQDRMLLGHLLMKSNELAEAEKVFRELWERNHEDLSAALLLVRVLADQRKTEEARDAIVDVRFKVGAPEKAAIFSAQAYEYLSDHKQAKEAYLQALSAFPDDTRLLKMITNFLVNRDDAAEAERYVDRIITLTEKTKNANDLSWARRTKAELLARRGSYQDFQDALNLIRQNVPSGARLSGEDLATFTRLASRRADPGVQQEALSLLLDEKQQRKLTPNELFYLARLQRSLKQWREYKETMPNVLAESQQVEHWSDWLGSLLRHDELDMARLWVDKHPDPGAKLTFELEILVRQGEKEKVKARLKELLPDPVTKENSPQLAGVAALVDRLARFDPDLHKFSTQIMTQFVKLNPDQELKLAALLSGQPNIDALKPALDRCESALAHEKKADLALQIALSALRKHAEELDGQSPPFLRVASWLDRLMQESPDNPTLILRRAEFEEIRNDRPAIKKWYGVLLKRDDISPLDRAVALNNLAYRLADEGKTEEATKLIEDAIRVLGPTPDVLDTRAYIYLKSNQLDKALLDLQKAAQISNLPIIYVHLSRAHLRKKNIEEAVLAFNLAQEMGLDPATLNGDEKKGYEDLMQELQPHLQIDQESAPSGESA